MDVKGEVLTLVMWQKGIGKNKDVANKCLLHIVSNAFLLLQEQDMETQTAVSQRFQ